MKIPILLNEQLLSNGYTDWIMWVPEMAPHAIIIGATGSGKTYFSTLLLGKIILHLPQTELYVCDFKGDKDFTFLQGCSRYSRYRECEEGLTSYYKQFTERQLGKDKGTYPVYLFFDEWASFINSMDKKKQDEYRNILASLLMLGRSFNFHVIISQQRADAQYFQSARDNLSLVIALGNISTESKDMFFHEYKNMMLPDRARGTGYMLINGTEFSKIIVPKVNDTEKLHQVIRQGVLNSTDTK